MRLLLCIMMILAGRAVTNAQEVSNTSYLSQTGEKVLRLEMIVPVDKTKAWELFTKDQQLKKWIAPLAHIELRTGGYIVTNYNSAKSLSDSSSIKLIIINYIDEELLTLKVTLNNNFAKLIRNEDENLQEIIQFREAGADKTKIISSMVGWGKGPNWDKAYDFFVRGNEWTYEEMCKLFK